MFQLTCCCRRFQSSFLYLSSQQETNVSAALHAGSQFVSGIELELRYPLRSAPFRAGLVFALGAGATR